MQEGIKKPRNFIQLGSKTKRNAAGTLIYSQLVLLQSRKKWGIIYTLATVVGLFCVPTGGLTSFILLGGSGGSTVADALFLVSKTLPLPAASFLILTGMYILNDLVDADLDRSNGKKRPIPSGQVPKVHASIFVILTNVTLRTLVTR